MPVVVGMSTTQFHVDIKEHSQWVAEKVAEAKEIGIRDGSDGLKVAHVIALLFKQITKW